MRILVTGGAGFLGSHLCERLVGQGHQVIALDNFFTGRRENLATAGNMTPSHILYVRGGGSLEIVRADVCDPMHYEVDRIYHLACPASPVHYQRNPARTIRTCVQGTLHALELAREVGARVFLASTSEVYGDPLVHPQVETYFGNVNPVGPRACYDEGKRCAEALATSYAQQYSVEVRIARIFNTYGPRMAPDDGRVVSNFIVQALRSQPLTIYGEGAQTRSFCYVDDLIVAITRLMEVPMLLSAGPVNIGNPTEFTVRQLAELVRDRIDSSLEIIKKPLPSDDPKVRRPDISRAIQLLDWQPKIQLSDGLTRTIEYFRSQIVRLDV